MPYAAQRLKLVAHGHIGAVQTWSTDIQCRVGLVSGAWSVDGLQALTTDVEAYFETWALGIHQFWSPQTTFAGIRSYYYEAGGDRATLQAQGAPAAPIAGSGGHGNPTQTCVVASLRTERVGRSYRGRSYAPFTGGALDLTGEMNNADVVTIADAYQTLLTSLNGYSGGDSTVTDLTCVVASAVASALTPITSVIVDSEPDIQRRRADKIGAVSSVTRAI